MPHQVEEQPIDVELSFTSFDDCWRPFLGGQGPAGSYAASLDEQKRGGLEASLRRRLIGGRSDGSFTMQGRVWAARGVVPKR